MEKIFETIMQVFPLRKRKGYGSPDCEGVFHRRIYSMITKSSKRFMGNREQRSRLPKQQSVMCPFRAMSAIFSKRLGWGDRKSTRLNSSHVKISYAVFCLKKKKKKTKKYTTNKRK